MAGEELSREERKKEYQRVLSIVERNTGGKQPAMASRASISQIALDAGITQPQRRMQAAIENDDLMRWCGRVCRVEEDALVDVIEAERNQKHSRRQVIARANEYLQDLRGGDSA